MAAFPPLHLNPQTTRYQGASEMSSEPSEEVVATLLVRHLPEAIPYDTLSRLFSHYGASSVRPCTGGRYWNHVLVWRLSVYKPI